MHIVIFYDKVKATQTKVMNLNIIIKMALREMKEEDKSDAKSLNFFLLSYIKQLVSTTSMNSQYFMIYKSVSQNNSH